ncbi:hypothetical protein BB558_001257 [Smittium angustum]|uniref:Uncharacterized protein n=1 Tax=Smittium angustum TaxID=133377 RepID=A0A2U1JC69_SMIAN|nr:hypothetical protein BB558_001257 [Smittium angustum]
MKLSSITSFLASAFLFVNNNNFSVQAAVLGIDYGADSFKVAIANPGRSMDIVLNRDSKRKTPSAITIKGTERSFGTDAVNLSGRYPDKTVLEAKTILGALYNDTVTKNYMKKYGTNIVKLTDKGEIGFDFDLENQRILRPQEIVAMQLKYAIEVAKETEGINLKDAIITVPSYFDQTERQAMKDAIELSGINPLGLLNDGSAVALNYAMGRTFAPEPVVHMFVDMGAASTVITVASFKSKLIKNNGVSKNTTIVNNMGYSVDNTLGGSEMDSRLRELIIDHFEKTKGKSTKSPIRNNKRAMARALKEANRVKTILSVNSETSASLESLHEDIDFSMKITRQDFEKLVEDLGSHLVKLVDDALKATELKNESISSVVVAGGGARVPYMQLRLSDIFGPARISKAINSDEACVMGSVFKAASLSSQFRVKDIRLRDSYGYAVRAVYSEEGSGYFAKEKPTKNLIMPKFSTIGVRKSFLDTRKTDFTIDFEVESGSDFVKFATASITGIPEAIKQMDKSLTVDPKPQIEVGYWFDKYGIFETQSAYAIFNLTNPGYDAYLLDLMKWNEEQVQIRKAQSEASSKSKSSGSEDSTQGNESVSSSSSEPSNSTKPTPVKSRPMPKTQQKYEIRRVALKVQYNLLNSNELTKEEKKSALDYVKSLEKLDRERAALADAKNSLESFIYKLKYFVEGARVIAVTDEKQRNEIINAYKQAADWYEDKGDQATIKQLQDQLKKLKDLHEPVHLRSQEYESIPEKLEDLKQVIGSISELAKKIETNYPQEEIKLVDINIEKISKNIADTKKWIADHESKYEKSEPHKSQTFTTKDIEEKIKEQTNMLAKLTREVIKIVAKPKAEPKPSAAADKKESDDLELEEPKLDQSSLPVKLDDDKKEPAHDEL